jgi:hypothetical protein
VAVLNAPRRLATLLLALVLLAARTAAAAAPTEEQIKAVFVFNFSLFVEWPQQAFAATAEPLVIGVLGNDAFAAQLEEAVQGEQSGGHPLLVRRFASAAELDACHILFIDRSQGAQIGRILDSLAGHTLTVSDMDEAARGGVMIQFEREGNRVGLLINVDAARSAGLTLSSKLLRPARIVRTSR